MTDEYQSDILTEMLSTDENPVDSIIRFTDGKYITDSIDVDDIEMTKMLNESISG